MEEAEEATIRSAIRALTKRAVRGLKDTPLPESARMVDVDLAGGDDGHQSDDGDGYAEPPMSKDDIASSLKLPRSLIEVLYAHGKPHREIMEEARALMASEDVCFRSANDGHSPSPSLTRKELSVHQRLSVFGAWLPENRYSIDQVPCNLVSGDGRTYEMKGSKTVWVGGAGKGDESKRICTLQLIVRCFNGPRGAVYCGQPWPEICFRGQGKRIRAEETAGYAPNVWVTFQPKAWYDDANCLRHANKRIPIITASARRAGLESVIVADNLHGQTTEEYIGTCWKQARAKMHLLPGGLTDIMQLIDKELGHLVKHYLGEEHSSWCVEGDNNRRWMEGMALWEKRVHLTHMLQKAYARACSQYDFEKNAAQLGMLMTADGTGDGLIKLQGFENYSFTDADGGDDGQGSSADEVEEEEDVDPKASLVVKKTTEPEYDDDSIEATSGESSAEEEDDTAEVDARASSAVGLAAAPEGFTILDSEPELDGENGVNVLIGEYVLFKWTGAPVPAEAFGWYLGLVKKLASNNDRKLNPKVNLRVSYSNRETGDVLPFHCGWPAKWAETEIPLGLEPETWGVTKQWIVVKAPQGYIRPKQPKGKSKKK